MTPIKTSAGRWRVRWREGGRGSRHLQRTFDNKRDAMFFEASMRRAKQLGQLSSELVGSAQVFQDFCVEWWDKYAWARLAPGTLASYAPTLDKWITPYLGRMRLRDLSRETIDNYIADIKSAGAAPPTVNRCVAIIQGILERAVEWRRLPINPARGVRRLAHTRSTSIDARTPDEVEAIRAQMSTLDAALVSVLAYEGLRPAEAFALCWGDVLDRRGRARDRMRVERALSGGELSTTKSKRNREPDLFGPVSLELLELHMRSGRPDHTALVFPDTAGGHRRRQNWRQRVWIPALRRAGVPYFRPYDLRHTCATLLIYEGRPVTEVAEHMGHADPGFTARTYGHVFRDAGKNRRVPIETAIADARAVSRTAEV